jgi:ERCC4-type nuclease
VIFVDPAQGSADLAPLLAQRGLEVQVTHLGSADVEFAGRGAKNTSALIGVEVKRLGELTSDYERLAGHQLHKLLARYDHRWLVWEGEWVRARSGALVKKLYHGNMKPLHGQNNAASLQKKLLTLELLGGLHVQGTRNRRDTVDFLVTLYRWWTDDAFDEHRSHIVHYVPHGLIPLTEVQQAFAAWPGLSLVRCKAVAAHFKNSLRLAVGASVDEWASIEVPEDEGRRVRKLGHKTAERMVRFLQGEHG